MIRSFTKEATYLDRFLLNLQCEGWEIISVTPIEEKTWNGTAKMYVDKNLFNIIAENKKFKPIKIWWVDEEEFYTKEEAWIYAESRELNPYKYVRDRIEYVEAGTID